MEEKEFNWKKWILLPMTYILVAVFASAGTLALSVPKGIPEGYNKLAELKSIITGMYIGEVDETHLEDMAAAAMVDATGDRWSYYIPASQLQAAKDQKANAYVGIGVTINILEEDAGFRVDKIEPDSPAKEGGVQIGDVIVAVDGQRVKEIGSDEAKSMVAGEENTQVTITVLRDEQELDLTLTRRRIMQQVASGEMVTDTIGYIQINNFNERSAQETIALLEQLEEQGAKAIIFDVRFNPGGYKDEMVDLLDYLLPEGDLFCSEDYLGNTSKDTSDADCKDMPFAVLINGESYSAAEFFAAALKEYECGITVGQPTTGKGYFQITMELQDGSAVNLSIGKYYTPKGVSLAEVGGLVPDVLVEIDEETMAKIYSDSLLYEEDAQLQAAIAALQEQIQ